MCHDQIITELFLSSELDSCIAKMVREDLRADFKQELFLILCRLNCGTLKEIYDRGDIKYYVVRIIINLSRQERNIFHKQYLNRREVGAEYFPDDYDRELAEEKETKHETALKKLSEMDNHFGTFYYRLLADLVKRHGSMNKAAKASGIPLTTISNGFKKIREHLKQEVDV